MPNTFISDMNNSHYDFLVKLMT